MTEEKKRDFVYKYWFPEDYNGTIYIVCPKDSSPTYDAYLWSDDYADIDSCGDKDLLLIVYGFISKYYPKAKIERYYVDKYKAEYPIYWKKNNIIILGGPAYQHDACLEFMYGALKTIYSHTTGISHPPVIHALKNHQERWRKYSVGTDSNPGICLGCDFLKNPEDPNASCRDLHTFCIWRYCGTSPCFLDIECNHTLQIVDSKKTTKELEREVRSHLKTGDEDRLRSENGKLYLDRCVSKDVGFFAAFENPYDDQHGTYSKTRVVMINGKHTLGGVGAFSAFDVEHNVISLKNYKILDEFLDGKSKDFVSFFHVEIDENARTCTQCPTLSLDNFISLNKNTDTKKITQREFDDRIRALKCKIEGFKTKLQAISTLPIGDKKSKTQIVYNMLVTKANELLVKLSPINLLKCDEYEELVNIENYLSNISQEWEDIKNEK